MCRGRTATPGAGDNGDALPVPKSAPQVPLPAGHGALLQIQGLGVPQFPLAARGALHRGAVPTLQRLPVLAPLSAAVCPSTVGSQGPREGVQVPRAPPKNEMGCWEAPQHPCPAASRWFSSSPSGEGGGRDGIAARRKHPRGAGGGWKFGQDGASRVQGWPQESQPAPAARPAPCREGCWVLGGGHGVNGGRARRCLSKTAGLAMPGHQQIPCPTKKKIKKSRERAEKGGKYLPKFPPPGGMWGAGTGCRRRGRGRQRSCPVAAPWLVSAQTDCLP